MTAPRDLEGRRILLTGATGSVGRVAARMMAEAGAHVILNGRDAARLALCAAALPVGQFTLAPFDIGQADQIVPWIRDMTEKSGPLHGIAHTAAVQITRPLRSLEADMADMILHTNVTTSLMLGKALRQKASHVDGAAFALVASTAAYIGGAGNIPYAASKGAVIAAAKGMAHELLRDKIRVNVVVPGLIESDMSVRAQESMPPESWVRLLSGYPMGIGKPEDVANALIFLLSDRSRWMTGSELRIDGGLSIV